MCASRVHALKAISHTPKKGHPKARSVPEAKQNTTYMKRMAFPRGVDV